MDDGKMVTYTISRRSLLEACLPVIGWNYNDLLEGTNPSQIKKALKELDERMTGVRSLAAAGGRGGGRRGGGWGQ